MLSPMDNAQRIAQFENMANADPTNEMAHFSLAKAYLDVGRPADAAASYKRCIELVPDMSKAYQLAGEAYIKANDAERAAAVLSEGYGVASQKGDLMPKRAIADLLRSIGKPVPEVEGADAAAEQVAAAGGFTCSKTGRLGTKLAHPPFRGPVGQWISENISEETWKAWIAQGTKVINELRLDLSRDPDSETYDRYMREYLGIDEELFTRLAGSPSS